MPYRGGEPGRTARFDGWTPDSCLEDNSLCNLGQPNPVQAALSIMSNGSILIWVKTSAARYSAKSLVKSNLLWLPTDREADPQCLRAAPQLQTCRTCERHRAPADRGFTARHGRWKCAGVLLLGSAAERTVGAQHAFNCVAQRVFRAFSCANAGTHTSDLSRNAVWLTCRSRAASHAELPSWPSQARSRSNTTRSRWRSVSKP